MLTLAVTSRTIMAAAYRPNRPLRGTSVYQLSIGDSQADRPAVARPGRCPWRNPGAGRGVGADARRRPGGAYAVTAVGSQPGSGAPNFETR